MKSNLENWIIHDHNPFIIFSNESKVVYTNEAGEYLLSFIPAKKIYDTIIKYAPKDIGFLHIREHFVFDKFSYDYALIGYDNYDEIGVRFYQNIKPLKKLDLEMEKLNIYFIIDLVRTYVFIDKEPKFKDLFDVDLPDIKFNKDKLIKTLTHIYEMVKENDEISTEVKLRIGEYIKIYDKKYKILEVSICAKKIDYKDFETDLIDIVFDKEKVSILIPFII